MTDYNNTDYNNIVERRGTCSLKWDMPGNEILPMWVADMDFRTAQPIIDALHRRVQHGVFGYTHVPDEYYEALESWFSRRHGWTINRADVIPTIGVVPALYAIIKALSRRGDNLIIPSPAYNCFYYAADYSGCNMTPSLLINNEGNWSLNFEELEKLTALPDSHLLILCNPHNPVGRIWTPEELTRVAQICAKNEVTVIADEIHCELSMPGHDYTPFAPIAAKEGCKWIALNSPSKAFNLAGLRISNIVCPDADVREKINRGIQEAEIGILNSFGVPALIAAYNESEAWLDGLREYLWENFKTLKDELSRRMPQLKVSNLQATYLAWVDISATGLDADTITDRLLNNAKVKVCSGGIYGPGGENYIRVNFGCPRSTMLEGLERIESELKPLLSN